MRVIALFLVFTAGCSLLPPFGAAAGAGAGAAVGGPGGAAVGALAGHVGGSAAQESLEQDPAAALAGAGLTGPEIAAVLAAKDESFSDKLFRLMLWAGAVFAVFLFAPPLHKWPGGIKKWIARQRGV